jgi:adenylate kinase
MEHAKESKTVVRLRRKLRQRLREESKVIKKRVLKKISQVIRLRFSRYLLDTHTVNVIEGGQAQLSSGETLQKLRAKILRDSERLSALTRKALRTCGKVQ